MVGMFIHIVYPVRYVLQFYFYNVVYCIEQVSKEEVDSLATQFQESPDSSVSHVYPVIPMCMISIHADADTSLYLEYEVPVEGIVETKTIFIMRSISIESMHQCEILFDL